MRGRDEAEGQAYQGVCPPVYLPSSPSCTQAPFSHGLKDAWRGVSPALRPVAKNFRNGGRADDRAPVVEARDLRDNASAHHKGVNRWASACTLAAY